MNWKLKLLRRIVSLILAILLFINPLVVPLVYAEEEEVTPTAVPQSTITTGDAEASSDTDTTVNTNTDIINGSLTTPMGSCSPPEGQTSCPDDITIDNTNQATVSASVDSSANTGENQESGSAGDALIDTGDATASGEMVNNINENTVVFETTPTPTGSVPQEGTGEVKDLKVTNENDGKVTNNADISAKTGENLASENLGDVDLQTGDALAWLNMLNLVNTNVVGSNFEILFLDIKEGDEEINLNELWKLLQEKNGTDSLALAGEPDLNNLHLIIKNLNAADLENKVTVCAVSGGNEASGNEDVNIDTDNATALANVANIVNTNIVGSKFLFGIINILGQFKGNLILPRPELFMGIGDSGSGTGAVFESNNLADISNEVQTTAATGNNQADSNSGDNMMTTGEATSSTNTYSLVNLNVFRNDWFHLLLNNLGDWEGKIYGWSNPGAVEENSDENQTFHSSSNGTLSDGEVSLEFQNNNTAKLTNDITVSASTGENQANENRGDTVIKTGDAKAFTNLINLVNVNILGGRWFMGLVNILGGWSGNTFFAYPDLMVSLSGNPDTVFPGDSFEYILNFGNQGYDDAEGVSVKMEFPKGLSYEGDDSGIQANCAENTCLWDIGNLERAESGSFKIKVKLDPDFFSLGTVSFWEKLVPKVYAAENSSSLSVKAVVTTITPDSNADNNVAIKTTEARMPSLESEQVDQRQPVLEITAKNNVNDFVYPRDIITFEVTVKNTGEVRSEDTYLTHALYNGVPEDFGVADIKMGTIEPGKTAKVSFGITLVDGEEFHVGSYHTVTKAIGFAPNGKEVASGEVRTDFKVKSKETSSFFEAQAIEKKEERGEVLGAAAVGCPPPQEEILPYVLLFLLSSLWIVERSRKLNEKL